VSMRAISGTDDSRRMTHGARTSRVNRFVDRAVFWVVIGQQIHPITSSIGVNGLSDNGRGFGRSYSRTSSGQSICRHCPWRSALSGGRCRWHHWIPHTLSVDAADAPREGWPPAQIQTICLNPC
jgi:hypothetical protein